MTLKLVLSAAIGAAILIAASPSSRAAEVDLPYRKGGQWELKTVMDEGRGPKEQVLTMCVDEEMEKNTALASRTEHKDGCTKYEVVKSGDKYVIDAQCTFNERDVTSHTEMSGDFAKSFEVKIESTTSGTNGSQAISVKRTITQSGTYQGESCGDLKAGEARGTDGKKVLVQ
jgi:hypothetical protein